MARGRKPGAVRAAGPRLPAVDEALAELAAYFRRRAVVPDQELVRLTVAARAGGSRWDAIAAACGFGGGLSPRREPQKRQATLGRSATVSPSGSDEYGLKQSYG
jgi:hypothetical protein